MNWYEKGGAAFPIPHSNEPGAYEAETGMSLRDYFAGQALISLGELNPHLPDDPADPRIFPDPANIVMRRAKFAYLQADAMLLARGQA